MDLDQCLSQIKKGLSPSEADINMILDKLSEILYQEPTLLNLKLPFCICGDIHGQLFDLFELFRISGGIENNRYLFLGDYVDRGFFSVETFCYLAILKLKYPDRIYLLRGNHESKDVNASYGFIQECESRFGNQLIWKRFNEVFELLPISAIIDETIFCTHGGLSPDIKYVEQIGSLDRRVQIPAKGALCDLTWSDPDESMESWQLNCRGAGYLFGQKITNQFCNINKLDLICRAHQLAMQGYTYHFGEEQLCTVWSAPNYMYRSGNIASVLKIDENKRREFVIFDAVPDDLQSQYFA